MITTITHPEKHADQVAEALKGADAIKIHLTRGGAFRALWGAVRPRRHELTHVLKFGSGRGYNAEYLSDISKIEITHYDPPMVILPRGPNDDYYHRLNRGMLGDYQMKATDATGNNRMIATGTLIHCANLAWRLYNRLGMDAEVFRFDGSSLRLKARRSPLPH
jgi:hypothetical protein